jgi:hypothetical protein
VITNPPSIPDDSSSPTLPADNSYATPSQSPTLQSAGLLDDNNQALTSSLKRMRITHSTSDSNSPPKKKKLDSYFAKVTLEEFHSQFQMRVLDSRAQLGGPQAIAAAAATAKEEREREIRMRNREHQAKSRGAKRKQEIDSGLRTEDGKKKKVIVVVVL